MPWESALTATAEVGIGIAGFSGLFAAIARRSPESWGPREQVTLEVLVLASGTAIFASLLPFLLLESGVRGRSCWAIGSAAYGAWQAGVVAMRIRQSLRMGTWPLPPSALASLFIAGVVVVLHGINVFLVQAPWPFMVGVYHQLLVAFVAFRQLLSGALRPPAA